MADSNAQDKNLPASQRKLDKARAEGQVARSRDLGHFTAVAAGGALLVALQTPTFMTTRMGELVIGLLFVVVPFGVVMMAVAIAGGVAMSGWTWTFKPLAPRFEQFNPLVGITRIFAKAQLIDAMKASALALILGTIGAFYLRSHIDAFVGVLAMPLPAAIGEASQVLLHGLGLLLLALAAFALIDVPLQRHLHAQRQKMSHQELKQEHKELEGNAEVKSKVRARMREMTKRRMMAAVPTADLVVMNPTHYAVALKYDEGSMTAPRVVAKGADLLALKIRDTAEGAKVPVLQAPVLARALYAHAELDREIPAALFAAVAQVLAYVYQLRAALRQGAPSPGEMPAIDVPLELDPHHRPA